MSATVHILPVIRSERDGDAKSLVISLSPADFHKLEKLAKVWNYPVAEVASDMLHEMLRGRR